VHRAFAAIEEPGAADGARTHAAVPRALRSQGAIDLSFRKPGNGFALGRTAQSGCLRLRLPRAERPGERPCVTLINTAGGVAGGDRLDIKIVWDDEAVATATTQAAEKVYRALAEESRISMHMTVGRGADAEWLPQETILFNGSRLKRDTRVLLDDGASFLGLESWVLGRKAMGETMRSGAIDDRLRIWRGGRLIYADALVLGGEIDALMQRAAIGGGAGAMAVLVHASQSAGALIEPVRGALEGARGRAAASTWNGLLAVRLLAADGETLRHDIALALGALREARPLPRVWRC
jgi:urease accessory protein